MATKATKSKILTIDPDIRKKRHRVKTDMLYQNWIVWSLGPDNIMAGVEYACRQLRAEWLQRYGEHIHKMDIYWLSLVRTYLATTQQQSFRPMEFAQWAVDNQRLPRSYGHKTTQWRMVSRLMNLHYFNPLDIRGRYCLTLRVKQLFRAYSRHIEDYFGPEGRILPKID